jgi:lauroyl/myristoyl acyltransferase
VAGHAVCASAIATGDTIVEAFWGFGASAEQPSRHACKFADAELIQRAIDRSQTIVLLCGAPRQLGVAAAWRAAVLLPIPIDVVYQPQRLASLDEFLRDVRCRFGGKLIPRKQFVYETPEPRREPRAYALIADQTPRKEDPQAQGRASCARTNRVLRGGRQDRQVPRSPVYFVSMKRERRGH